MTAAVVLTTSCSKDDETDKEPKIGQNPMTMTATLPNVSIYMTVKGTVKIDWGDKTEIESQTVQFDSSLHFTHAYSDFPPHTITIAGDSITYLACHKNGLEQLDVSMNPALSTLICEDNFLKSLDVSHNTLLESLYCKNNELIDINVSNNRLYIIDCSNNQLSQLDFSANVGLWAVSCENNKLTSEAINEMFRTLHNYDFSDGRRKLIHIYGNPGMDDCDKSIAENKGWSVYSVPFLLM